MKAIPMASAPTSLLVPASALAVLAIALVGCGGDDGGSGSGLSPADRHQLTRLSAEISTIGRTKDAKEFCSILQPSQVRRRFPSFSRCVSEFRSILEESPESAPLKVDHMTGTDFGARVYYRGSQSPVDFVRENGRWYVAFAGGGAGGPAGGGEAGQDG